MLDVALLPDARRKFRLTQISAQTVTEKGGKLRQSLHQTHRRIVADKTERARRERAKKQGAVPNFGVGDFVLWSKVDARLGGNKLQARWLGPFAVIETRSHAFMIQHLVTKALSEVHGSRLKFYCDPSLAVTEEILELVASQSTKIGVEDVVGHRWNDRTKQWELMIKWRGLQEQENSWEPFVTMHEDIPNMVADYLETNDVAELQALIAGT